MFSINYSIDWDESATVTETKKVNWNDFPLLLNGDITISNDEERVCIKFENILMVLDALYTEYCLSLLTLQSANILLMGTGLELEVTVRDGSVKIKPLHFPDNPGSFCIDEKEYLNEIRRVLKEVVADIDRQYPDLVKSLEFIRCFRYVPQMLFDAR